MKRFISTDGKEVSKSKKTDECLIFEPKENGVTIMTKLLPTDEQLRKASDWLVEWGGNLDVDENGDGIAIETDPNTFTVKLKGEKITEAADEQISTDWLNWVGQFAEEKEKAKAGSAKPEEDPKPTAKPEEDPKPAEDPKPTAKPAEEDPDPGPTDSGKDSGSPFVAGEKPYWEEPQEKWGEIFDRQVDFYLKQYEETAS